MKHLWLLAFSVCLLLVACGSEPQTVEVPVTAEVTREVEVEVTRPVEVTREVVQEVTREVEVTRIVEVTRVVEEMVVATPTLEPIPEVFLDIEGTGDIVTENYTWNECGKAVFYWTAAGRDNVIIHLNSAEDPEDWSGLVNEIGPGEGQVLEPFSAGTYFLEISGPIEGWTFRGECQD